MKLLSEELKDDLKKKLKLSNPMQVPRITKIVLNIGLSEAITTKSVIQHAQEQLSKIAGQKAVVTKARKSISAFKLRQGLPIGVKVTLRGKNMESFLQRLVYAIIPRKKDFRGIKASAVDTGGNLNLGFAEQTIFPEIEFDSVDRIRGLQITIVSTAESREQGRALYEAIGIPFEKE